MHKERELIVCQYMNIMWYFVGKTSKNRLPQSNFEEFPPSIIWHKYFASHGLTLSQDSMYGLDIFFYRILGKCTIIVDFIFIFIIKERKGLHNAAWPPPASCCWTPASPPCRPRPCQPTSSSHQPAILKLYTSVWWHLITIKILFISIFLLLGSLKSPF